MSAVGSQLLEVIRADSSDAPRLVYADWLEEQGDVARATFVRSQLERARLPWWDRRAVALELEERALLAQHEAAWRAELPVLEGVTWGRFHRGFVDKVAFDDPTFLDKHLPAVLAAAPLAGLVFPWPRLGRPAPLAPMAGVRALTIDGPLIDEDDLDWLVESDLLPTLRELNLVETWLSNESVRHLVTSPDLGALTALRLPHHRFGNEGVDAFLESRSLGSLTELDLSGPTDDQLGSGGRDEDTIESDGIREFVTWPGFARLRSLDVTGQQIGADGLRWLLSVPSDLKVLRAGNLVDLAEAEGAALAIGAFGDAHPSLRLEELSLGEGSLDLAQAQILADAVCLSELRALRLDRVSEAETGAALRLAQAPWIDGTRVIELFASSGVDFVPPILARSPRALHSLRLGNAWGWDQRALLEVLLSSPGSNGLLSLDLTWGHGGDPLAQAFAGATGLQELRWLGLDGNRISAEAADALAASPLGQRLIGFDLDRERRLPSLGVSVPVPVPESLSFVHELYDGPHGRL